MADTVESITRQIVYWSEQYEDAKTSNAALKERIEQLDNALAYAKAAIKDVKELKKGIKSIGEDAVWCGRRKTRNEDLCGLSKTSVETLQTRIEDYRDSIKAEQSNLKSQVNSLVDLLASVEKTIDGLTDSLAKVANELSD